MPEEMKEEKNQIGSITEEDLTPVGDRVVVEVFDGEEETESGLILSKAGQTATPVVGTVIRAGSEAKYKVGQQIIWRRYAIDEIRFSANTDKKFYILESAEVIAVVDKNGEKGNNERQGNYQQIKEKKDATRPRSKNEESSKKERRKKDKLDEDSKEKE